MATIVETYEELKSFLLPGIYNLTNDDLNYALKLLSGLLQALDEVVVPFDVENERRIFINQLKIIQKELIDLANPIDPRTVMGVENMNLYRIALDELGDALRWAEILQLNNLSDPFLKAANELKLPTR